jgi:beta-lysine 5,6-aminomutase alpha subunit
MTRSPGSPPARRTRARQRPKLELDPVAVRKARSLARKAGRPIVRLAQQHTTVSVERATLRLAGLEGADVEGIPWVNRLLDSVRGDVGLEQGVALPVWDALVRGEAGSPGDLSTLAQKAAAGSVRFRMPEGRDLVRARPARRSVRGCARSTADAGSATGWCAGGATRRASRGST